ncbi:MAG TPA: histidine--tRNA ligase [Gemmataceae bacterium]|jgi:histidyl-tRNA synthetase|nr:histidine--tRNA ligase [Gemmataceae bacterium]
MADFIDPRTLKGFRDYLPELMIQRERLLEQARRVYRSYGFAPIDTPALEYAEILKRKGGEESDKLIYEFVDHGGREVALRFDLTVPFARFAAQHIGKLGTPFKRYHMGPVWRGENTAYGRFREFWQCDFDTIGTTANAEDIEIVLVIHDLLRALGLERFQIHINNRLLLNGLLEEMGLADHAGAILRVLDKLKKDRDATFNEMAALPAVGATRAQAIISLAETEGSNREILDQLQARHGENARASDGITRLRELLDVTAAAGVAEKYLQIDLSIARGLDYYTGTVYETFLTDLPGIGSVCSGGRYDNLAGVFTKQHLPGVGASLGLDRLLAGMEELKMLPKVATPAPVLIVQFSSERLADYAKMAAALRAAGIGVEVYPEAKKVGQQLQYAERRGFQVALIAGPDEFAKGVWKIKNLARREETTVPANEAVAAVRAQISSELG